MAKVVQVIRENQTCVYDLYGDFVGVYDPNKSIRTELPTVAHVGNHTLRDVRGYTAMIGRSGAVWSWFIDKDKANLAAQRMSENLQDRGEVVEVHLAK